ncbi:phosphatidylcholine transfer protein-like isoform X2 [Asterias rubens]|uniref:phosphatidylcholine transfer protein-like isoform X2 n=1 Tax=Asterias rubens TaxID=7604 RepID=UPI0014553C43|nr:phosphatidylcholine transfer protein-like isoform X2 [Asterias rubens]
MDFTDEEFEEACSELDNPRISDYEFFVESSGVQIYRKYQEDSGLYEYKVFGTLSGVGPETCAKVYVDLEYRKTWDSYVNKLYKVKDGDREGVYWRVNYPFPMSSRDYAFIRESREFEINDEHVWVILGRSVPFASKPPVAGVIRVDDFKQSMAIKASGDGSKAFMHYYDNPKGMIPTWLVNWAAKTGVPGFMQSMTDACNGYPEYLAKLERSKGTTS